jgi:UDP-glucose 4-epimerase/UDP-glucuronate decarboxylase
VAERVLITGGAGFVGLHLARRLLADGAEVTLLDDFSRGREDADLRAQVGGASHAGTAGSGTVELVVHDLTKPVPSGLLRGGYDSVYHLAAVVGVRKAGEQPGLVLNVNLRAALNVLDWCLASRPGAVFLSSTSEVMDGAARLGLASFPVPEDAPFALPDPALPRASYALSKVAAERLFAQCADEFRVRIGRYHNIYGPRMGYDHVIPQFIGRALTRTDPFPLYGAYQSRAFCYIDDAVAATVALTRLPGSEPLIANIGNDREEIRIDRVAERVLRLAGYQPEVSLFDPPPGSPDRRLPDLRTLRRLTGYEPEVGLDEGLRRTFDWYAARERDRLAAAGEPR